MSHSSYLSCKEFKSSCKEKQLKLYVVNAAVNAWSSIKREGVHFSQLFYGSILHFTGGV